MAARRVPDSMRTSAEDREQGTLGSRMMMSSRGPVTDINDAAQQPPNNGRGQPFSSAKAASSSSADKTNDANRRTPTPKQGDQRNGLTFMYGKWVDMERSLVKDVFPPEVVQEVQDQLNAYRAERAATDHSYAQELRERERIQGTLWQKRYQELEEDFKTLDLVAKTDLRELPLKVGQAAKLQEGNRSIKGREQQQDWTIFCPDSETRNRCLTYHTLFVDAPALRGIPDEKWRVPGQPGYLVPKGMAGRRMNSRDEDVYGPEGTSTTSVILKQPQLDGNDREKRSSNEQDEEAQINPVDNFNFSQVQLTDLKALKVKFTDWARWAVNSGAWTMTRRGKKLASFEEAIKKDRKTKPPAAPTNHNMMEVDDQYQQQGAENETKAAEHDTNALAHVHPEDLHPTRRTRAVLGGQGLENENMQKENQEQRLTAASSSKGDIYSSDEDESLPLWPPRYLRYSSEEEDLDFTSEEETSSGSDGDEIFSDGEETSSDEEPAGEENQDIEQADVEMNIDPAAQPQDTKVQDSTSAFVYIRNKTTGKTKVIKRGDLHKYCPNYIEDHRKMLTRGETAAAVKKPRPTREEVVEAAKRERAKREQELTRQQRMFAIFQNMQSVEQDCAQCVENTQLFTKVPLAQLLVAQERLAGTEKLPNNTVVNQFGSYVKNDDPGKRSLQDRQRTAQEKVLPLPYDLSQRHLDAQLHDRNRERWKPTYWSLDEIHEKAARFTEKVVEVEMEQVVDAGRKNQVQGGPPPRPVEDHMNNKSRAAHLLSDGEHSRSATSAANRHIVAGDTGRRGLLSRSDAGNKGDQCQDQLVRNGKENDDDDGKILPGGTTCVRKLFPFYHTFEISVDPVSSGKKKFLPVVENLIDENTYDSQRNRGAKNARIVRVFERNYFTKAFLWDVRMEDLAASCTSATTSGMTMDHDSRVRNNGSSSSRSSTAFALSAALGNGTGGPNTSPTTSGRRITANSLPDRERRLSEYPENLPAGPPSPVFSPGPIKFDPPPKRPPCSTSCKNPSTPARTDSYNKKHLEHDLADDPGFTNGILPPEYFEEDEKQLPCGAPFIPIRNKDGTILLRQTRQNVHPSCSREEEENSHHQQPRPAEDATSGGGEEEVLRLVDCRGNDVVRAWDDDFMHFEDLPPEAQELVPMPEILFASLGRGNKRKRRRSGASSPSSSEERSFSSDRSSCSSGSERMEQKIRKKKHNYTIDKLPKFVLPDHMKIREFGKLKGQFGPAPPSASSSAASAGGNACGWERRSDVLFRSGTKQSSCSTSSGAGLNFPNNRPRR
ncbi:unnamed protein product [Amoebophrya sp. A120]|nr:unnamed protein product [Amoebophrya sp. A120]|eukprot:GSA120T00020752001.1